MITIHTIVRNEEIYIKQALLSVLFSNKVGCALVWDTGSTDRTVRKILSINDVRIQFQQRGRMDRMGLVKLRAEQLKLTGTPWFMLVDGDEIWPQKNLNKLILAADKCAKSTIALINRTRNAVGDVYHYLPESKGNYRIGPWRGNLNIRAIKNLPGLGIKGEYPNEWYELNGEKLQDKPEKLEFVDTWYLHATHLKRSDSWLAEIKTIDRIKKHKWFYGLRKKRLMKMKENEIPEAFRR